ncbi:YfhD family protein [Psychrobacillus sp. PGGUH221]|uniref:YfhD family protein n=1 Tax=Psychrobacillus sp. PGGUH221 TaxID=3020058 RepID=UPI0035C6B051
MGRDNKQGKSKNKDSLPQTPKNQKIKPNEIQEEFSREFAELREKGTNKLNNKKS